MNPLANKKLVLIAGLGHSGSTLLDLLLGGHGEFIGLGELKWVVSATDSERAAFQGIPCSCGVTMGECRFWKGVLCRFRLSNKLDKEQSLAILLEEFDRAYRGESVIVDSSKYLPHLQWLSGVASVDLSVLHIIRDVRSFTISQLDLRQHNKAPYRFINRFRHFVQWHKRNMRIRDFLEQNKVPHLRIGYEELALYPELILTKVCHFLGAEYRPSMLDLGASSSHSVFGNRMRQQPEKMSIAYDHRWLSRNEWLAPATIFPGIMRFNARHVYSNKTERLWER